VNASKGCPATGHCEVGEFSNIFTFRQWDDLPEIVTLGREVQTAILANIPLNPAVTDALEVGSGTGRLRISGKNELVAWTLTQRNKLYAGLLALALLPHLRSLLCVDIAQGMNDALGKKIALLPTHEASKIQVRRVDLGNAQDFNLLLTEGRKFDFVYSHLVMHHIEDVGLVVQRIAKLLNVG
jgi:SAM-dependent methyltransferase